MSLPRSIPSCENSGTGTAHALRPFFRVLYSCVGIRELVTALAMCCPCILGGWTNPTKNVGTALNKFDVPRIATGTIPAEVVGVKPCRDFSSKYGVGNPVRKVAVYANVLHVHGWIAKNSVTLQRFSGSPFPTSFKGTSVDLRPEPFEERGFHDELQLPTCGALSWCAPDSAQHASRDEVLLRSGAQKKYTRLDKEGKQ